MLLVSASPGDQDMTFELHALGGEDELIAFELIGIPADRVNIAPARYQRLVEKGVFQVRSPDGVRQLGIVEFAYDVAEQPWRQIVIPVPLDAGSTMLVKAQAHEWRVPEFFPAAQHVAATLGRLG